MRQKTSAPFLDTDTTDWEYRSVDGMLRAIHSALKAGEYYKARRLAAEGKLRFPENPDMVKHAKILAPAEVIKNNLPADPDGAKDMQWLKEHRDEYRNQWVALLHGEFLDAAPTLPELIECVGNPKGTGILVTQVI